MRLAGLGKDEEWGLGGQEIYGHEGCGRVHIRKEARRMGLEVRGCV